MTEKTECGLCQGRGRVIYASQACSNVSAPCPECKPLIPIPLPAETAVTHAEMLARLGIDENGRHV